MTLSWTNGMKKIPGNSGCVQKAVSFTRRPCQCFASGDRKVEGGWLGGRGRTEPRAGLPFRSQRWVSLVTGVGESSGKEQDSSDGLPGVCPFSHPQGVAVHLGLGLVSWAQLD